VILTCTNLTNITSLPVHPTPQTITAIIRKILSSKASSFSSSSDLQSPQCPTPVATITLCQWLVNTTTPHVGRFEVLNFRGHEGGKYLCLLAGRRESSTAGDCFDTILIPQLSQHCTGARLVKCCTY